VTSELSYAAAADAAAGAQAGAVPRPAPVRRGSGSIRARLVMLVVALLIPGVLVAAILLTAAYRQGQDLARRQLQETARALSLVVDSQIAQTRVLLQSLAASGSLHKDDLAAFRDAAVRAAENLQTDVVLVDADGTQLVNTRAPLGTPLPNANPAESAVVWTAIPGTTAAVSSMFRGVTTGRLIFGLRMPVAIDGHPGRELRATLPVEALQRLLRAQALPDNWLGSVLDQRAVITARTRDAETFVGRRAGRQILGVIEAGGGVAETTSLDGVPSLTAAARSPVTGWTFVVAMPRREVVELATRSLTWGVPASFVLLVVGVIMAVLVARGIAGAVGGLTRSAAALGRGEPVSAAPTGLEEVDAAAAALVRAAGELQHREAAWRELNSTLEARVAQRTAALVESNDRLRREMAERGEAEERLRQAQKMEAVGQLTGGMAHDFNNLLQAMTSCLQLIGRRTGDRPELVPILQAGRQAVDRGAKLVQQLMAFSRRQAMRIEPVDVRDRVLGMSDLMGRALRADIRLELHVASDLWPVAVDPTQFELAVLNLAVNARDALPGGGILTIEAANTALSGQPRGLEGPFVHIVVSDNGTGMPAEVAARAFDPFFTTKEVGKGSGLGLSQVYGFAQQSGGAVWIHSQPGRGTAVHLLLPRAATAPAAQLPAAPAPPSSRRGGRVMMVEDDPVVAATVAAALEDAGYQVFRAATADEALGVLGDGAFDVLFSDVVMPGRLSGIDLVFELQRLRPGLPVILTTGYSEEVARIAGVRLLAKPYRIEELVQALDTALA
jgi:signal transduction histidine kinase/CheY-like chemotaxis protein